jgi:hypothetical protein
VVDLIITQIPAGSALEGIFEEKYHLRTISGAFSMSREKIAFRLNVERVSA